ncbi:MAG: prolipoprotein diacylglyceryl transferase, partial [Spirochaetaceae bacterium]
MTTYLVYPDWLQAVILPAVPIRWYTLFHLLGYLVVLLLFLRHLRAHGAGEEVPEARHFFFWFIIGYLAGARIGALLLFGPLDEVIRRPWLVLWPFDETMAFQGIRGLSFGGGLIGAAVALLLHHLRHRVNVLLWADALVVGIPLMFFLVRMGNFANQELYGRVTSLPWGMLFPEAGPVSLAAEGVYSRAIASGVPVISQSSYVNLPRHPAQLYEALLTGLIAWAFLMWLALRRQLHEGLLTATYLLLYGCAQFLLGYLRVPPIRDPFVIRVSPETIPPALFSSPLDLTPDQLLSLFFVVGGALMVRAVRR